VAAEPTIALVAAHDRHLAIGRDGQLPWHLPDDLKRFKSLTLGKPVLMGRKTAQSLGRALPGRRNIVLTRSGAVPFAGMDAVATPQEAIALAAGEPLMVIGGGEIYSLMLPMATEMHLTLVDIEVDDADAFFPRIAAADWEIISREAHAADARHAQAFEFLDYRRRS
jgi:dihydrofolate reductase